MVDFEKNGAKLSLMMFLTTFVPKKIGNVFANVDFHVNPHFAALCCQTFEIGKFEFSRAKYFKMQITNVEL